MPNDPAYIHGTHPDEQARLTRLNDLLNQRCARAIRVDRGDRVLDIGAGLGQMTRALARAAGSRAVGIERDPAQIAEALRQARAAGEEGLIDLRAGDVMNPPLRDEEWGAFTLAHARFVLEHVPDPLAVVRVMVRAVRPGGRIVLLDDDHDLFRVYPEVPGLATLWDAYMRTYDRLGNDPLVGRRLAALLSQAGARPARNDYIFFGACAGEPDFVTLVRNVAGILRGARERILAVAWLDDADLEHTLEEFHRWSSRPDAAIWYAVNFAEGVRP